MARAFLAAAGAVSAWLVSAAAADETPLRRGYDLADSGRLLATGGVTSVEGAAGGGLTPWAVIAGYGTRDSIGATAHATYIDSGDYRLETAGAAIGLFNRVEVSYAHQWFDTRRVGAALGLGRGYEIEQDVVGLKVRVLGDVVYDQDTMLPQIAFGIEYKKNNRADLLDAIGAGSADGIDYYLSATKLFLAQSLLVDATLRYTKANQLGLLGFGGDRNDGYRVEVEGSAALLLSRNLAIGAEYRTKPDNLSIATEDDAWDLFAAWFPSKNVSVTLAYVDLGNIVIADNQRGYYISLQAGF